MSDRGKNPEVDWQSATAPAEGPPADHEALRRGATLGRYVVIDRLGGGGMGVVYSAYDPELDRKLAVKLVRSSAGTSADRTRLLREAQAMARLAHPNVIAVHDVGTFENQVFIAMEFVEGATLGQWLAHSKRTWREVVEIFLQAARGLAAAHAAGIVHRDFKPDNVLVGDDGRVRVLDFGLARAAQAGGASEAGPPPPLQSPGKDLLVTPLTQTGAVIGTPAYAAPEQLLGRAVDERSDQFSFCVALYEGLYGSRPFAGETLASLVEAITEGRIAEPPRDTRVPDWLHQVVLVGLSSAPEKRHASMASLVAQLSRVPGRTRRRWIAGVAAVALAGAVGASYAIARRSAASVCNPERRLAGVWDAARARAVSSAFLASGKPYAGAALSGVQNALDRFGAAWAKEYGETCERTVRSAEPDESAYLQMACLSQRLDEAKAKSDLFVRADDKTIENAVAMVQSLGDPTACVAAAHRVAGGPPPPAPAVRARVEDVRKRLAAAKAHEEAGKYAEGLAIAKAAAEEARALQYRPLEAEASYQLGGLQDGVGRFKDAFDTLLDAAFVADATRYDELSARTWVRLTWIAADRLAQFDRAEEFARHASATLERMGGDDRIRARLHNTIGNLRERQGRFAEAVEAQRRALAIAEKTPGFDERELSWVLNDLGNGLQGLGRNDEAVALYERSLGIKKRMLGPMHPDVAISLSNLGNAELARKSYANARAHMQAAIDVMEKALGPEHAYLAGPLNNLGDALYEQHEYQAGLAVYQRALATWERTSGKDHPHTAYAWTGIGRCQLGLHAPRAALPALERAVALGEAHPGDAVLLADARFALAQSLVELRREPKRAFQLAAAARDAYAAAGSRSADKVAAVGTWMKQHGQ